MRPGVYYDPVNDEIYIVRHNYTSIQPWEFEYEDGCMYGAFLITLGHEVYLGEE